MLPLSFLLTTISCPIHQILYKQKNNTTYIHTFHYLHSFVHMGCVKICSRRDGHLHCNTFSLLLHQVWQKQPGSH